MDESGNNNHGVVHGATLTTDRFGNSNSAFHFNGNNQYIDLPTLALPNSLTISGWFSLEVDENTNNCALLSQATGYFDRWHLTGATPELVWYDRNGSDNNPYVINTTLQENVWYNLTAVASSDENQDLKVKLYLDGVYQGSVSTRGFGDEGIGFQIGRLYNEFGWDYSQGKMDEINIYDGELSADEVMALYKSPTVPEPSSLTLAVFGLLGISAYAARKQIQKIENH